jgi:transcriptional regulator with XRE-family HTH domain
VARDQEPSAFGRRLARLRRRQRLTQFELARRAGLSVAVVQVILISHFLTFWIK